MTNIYRIGVKPINNEVVKLVDTHGGGRRKSAVDKISSVYRFDPYLRYKIIKLSGNRQAELGFKHFR